MSVSPLLYIWGDDDLLGDRIVERFAAALERDLGAPLERWDVVATQANASTIAAQLHERLATPVMFGGGTLAVVANPGHLVRRNADRDRVVEAIAIVKDAPGNAAVFVHALTSQDRAKKGQTPGPQRLIKAITEAGGAIRQASAPTPAGLAAWIADEARERGLQLAPGVPKALAERLGSRVTQGDVDRRFLSRIAASELDKLALRHLDDGAPINPDDIEALVAAAVPASMWALTDAVGERKVDAALAALDRLIDTTPEPVILAALHRRVVEMLAMSGASIAERRIPESARAVGVNHPFVAEKAAGQASNWTTDELADALGGLLELDATVKGAPGYAADTAQRRLAFTMWVRDHAGRAVSGAG